MAEMLTFLLTDIEGSTARWEHAPDAMRAAVARHDAYVHDAVREHGGRVFKSTGDGWWALFASTDDAVEAAVAANLAVESADWGEVGPIRIRSGVHAAPAHEVEERGGDFYGAAMNRCARLTAVGHGGQILCSDLAVSLASPRSREWDFVDLGEHRLRDLQDAERIHQVTHPRLDRDFPPLASLDAFAHNLPVQRTSFVGREAELSKLAGVVQSTRLVTLTGAGGAGKTRLALAVAADVVDAFPHGVWLVDLAGIRDAGLLEAAVAAALRLREQTGTELRQTLLDHVRDRHLLLVVDNCEHLIADVAGLADALLDASPSVHVLATSRERLGLAGESVHRVDPLGVPPPDRPDDPDAEATRLFLDRAAALVPDFEMDGDARAAIGRICRRLDGIPLALELAAARLAVLSPGELEARLDDRFRLLTRAGRTAVPQHQTLQATLDWSHDLLDRDERVLFRRMAVFASAVPLHALELVAGDESLDPAVVLDVLTALVDKSMVTAERGTVTRYGMLETVRQYASQQLEKAGEVDAVRRRHAQWILEATDDVRVRNLSSPFTGTETLGTSLAETRAALGWLEENEPETALLLAAELTVVWFTHGVLSEGRERLESALRAAGDATSIGMRARAYTGLATLAVSQGDLDEAERWARMVVDPGGRYATRVMSLWVLGVVGWSRGDLDAAALLHEEGIGLARELAFPNGVRTHLNALARVHRSRGELDRAEHLDEEALAIARRTSDQSAIAPCLDGLARVAYLRGDLPRARDLASEARAGYEAASYIEGVASALTVSAAVELASGDPAAARDHLAAGLAHYRAIGHRGGMANALEVGAGVLAEEGDPEGAVRLLGAVRALREELGQPPTGDEPLLPADVAQNLAREVGDRFALLMDEGRALGAAAAAGSGMSAVV